MTIDKWKLEKKLLKSQDQTKDWYKKWISSKRLIFFCLKMKKNWLHGLQIQGLCQAIANVWKKDFFFYLHQAKSFREKTVAWCLVVFFLQMRVSSWPSTEAQKRVCNEISNSFFACVEWTKTQHLQHEMKNQAYIFQKSHFDGQFFLRKCNIEKLGCKINAYFWEMKKKLLHIFTQTNLFFLITKTFFLWNGIFFYR